MNFLKEEGDTYIVTSQNGIGVTYYGMEGVHDFPSMNLPSKALCLLLWHCIYAGVFPALKFEFLEFVSSLDSSRYAVLVYINMWCLTGTFSVFEWNHIEMYIIHALWYCGILYFQHYLTNQDMVYITSWNWLNYDFFNFGSNDSEQFLRYITMILLDTELMTFVYHGY